MNFESKKDRGFDAGDDPSGSDRNQSSLAFGSNPITTFPSGETDEGTMAPLSAFTKTVGGLLPSAGAQRTAGPAREGRW